MIATAVSATLSSGNEESRKARGDWAVIAVLGAMALVVVDAATANAALPVIARSLHIAPAAAVRVVTAYQTSLVMALLPGAALGEVFGLRRVFTLGVMLFVASAIACAWAPTLPWLLAARFCQGIGGAAVMALGLALVRHVVTQDRFGAAIGWNAMTVALASAAGPAIGALIVSVADWHWIFALDAPLGLGVLLTSRFLPDVAGAPRRLDLTSMVLNALFFGAMVLAIQMLLARPAAAAALFVCGALALALLVRREAPKALPLVPIDLLRTDVFRVAVIASICCFSGQTAGMVALPFYLQHSLGQSPMMAGLYLTTWPLAVALTAPVAGRLADRVSPRALCVGGGACLAVGLAAVALCPLRSQPLLLACLTALCGIGFGLFQIANNRTMFLAAPPGRSAAAGGMQGTARLTGQIAGALLVTLLFAWTPEMLAPRIALGIGAALVAIAAAVSTLRGPAKRGLLRPIERRDVGGGG